jgi:hypothetical protein
MPAQQIKKIGRIVVFAVIPTGYRTTIGKRHASDIVADEFSSKPLRLICFVQWFRTYSSPGSRTLAGTL